MAICLGPFIHDGRPTPHSELGAADEELRRATRQDLDKFGALDRRVYELTGKMLELTLQKERAKAVRKLQGARCKW